jgi:hypothetical protein
LPNSVFFLRNSEQFLFYIYISVIIRELYFRKVTHIEHEILTKSFCCRDDIRHVKYFSNLEAVAFVWNVLSI